MVRPFKKANVTKLGQKMAPFRDCSAKFVVSTLTRRAKHAFSTEACANCGWQKFSLVSIVKQNCAKPKNGNFLS